jgi:hypothetical protein
MTIDRMWINQPSELQRLHKYHGMNVLVLKEFGEFRAYFLSGPIISMQVPKECLSPGWKGEENA